MRRGTPTALKATAATTPAPDATAANGGEAATSAGTGRGELVLTAVTALLCATIRDGLSDRDVTRQIDSDYEVSALPPDRFADDDKPRVNLFLYQVTPHSGLRTEGADGLGIAGRGATDEAARRSRRLRPLGLELFYLVSTHGNQDGQMETLFGYVTSLLQAAAAWDAGDVARAMDRLRRRDAAQRFAALRDAPTAQVLAGAVRDLRMYPQFLPLEELSKLWTMLQARYRPSFVYRVSNVLLPEQRD